MCIFRWLWLLQKALYKAFKVLSKDLRPQVKKSEIFCHELDLSEFLSDFNDYYMKKHLF